MYSPILGMRMHPPSGHRDLVYHRLHGNSTLNILRNCQTMCQSGCAILHSYRQYISVSVSLHPRQRLLLFIFLYYNHAKVKSCLALVAWRRLSQETREELKWWTDPTESRLRFGFCRIRDLFSFLGIWDLTQDYGLGDGLAVCIMTNFINGY